MFPAELRKLYAGRRDALTPQERLDKSEQIWKRLVELPAFQEASQALFYISFRSEVDTTLMRSMARSLGKIVAAPRSEVGERRMVFHDLGSDEKLESGAFGLLQPAHDSETVTELQDSSVILVPGLVFDVQGNRLGWGGGYYDRFLSSEGKGFPTIGLAFDVQIAKSVPQQAHDVAVQWIVTESRVLDCQKI